VKGKAEGMFEANAVYLIRDLDKAREIVAERAEHARAVSKEKNDG